MADAHKNAAYSLVATAPSPATSGTSLVVTAGEGARFPSVPFNATIWAAGAQPSFVAGGTTGGNFEIVRVTAVSTDTLTITRAQEGTTARTVVVGDQIAATVTAKTLTDVEQTARSARSSNTILAASDLGQVIAATSAFTQTITAAATLGAGWWCLIKNDTTDGTTVLVVDPNGAETIDGLTTLTMYSGDTRLLLCNGSNFTTVLFEGGFAKFTPTGGNFIVPPGINEVDVVCIGSGGQGGGGFSGSASAGSGGGAGGGGAVTRAILRAVDLGAAGSTVTVTVTAGGSGSGAPGSNGANGGVSSFGSLLGAGGGGGGLAGAVGASVGAGGGGSFANSGATSTAGSPASSAAVSAIAGQAAGSPSAGSNGNNSEWGGASGGSSATGGTGKTGGSSWFGGPGGGGGGGCSTTVGQNGAAGGANQSYVAGGGGSAGTGGASPTAGGDSSATTPKPYCGAGGGGGGGGSTGQVGKNGGIGGIGSGGGGGGASANSTGGTGGAGGAGEVRVWYS